METRLCQVKGMADQDTGTGFWLVAEQVHGYRGTHMPPNPPERKDLTGSTVCFPAFLETASISEASSDMAAGYDLRYCYSV